MHEASVIGYLGGTLGSWRIGRTLVLVIALSLVSVACGSDSSEWCESAPGLAADAFDIIDPTATPEALEEAFTERLEFLAEVAEDAPSEIADDVEVLEDAVDGFGSLLAEYNWDFQAVAGADDDRFDAFDPDVTGAAIDNIAAFCAE